MRLPRRNREVVRRARDWLTLPEAWLGIGWERASSIGRSEAWGGRECSAFRVDGAD